MTLACGNYDRTRPLIDGTVRPEGIDLQYVVGTPDTLFRRVLAQGEFDAAELSLSNLITLIGRGDRELIGIPVFPSRMFRHGYVFVNADSGITGPRDLIGRRVGVPEYTMTAAVWIRGFLQHDFGVLPNQIQWFTGHLNTAGPRRSRITVRFPDDVQVQPIDPNASLGGLLEAGELDAVIGAAIPDVFTIGTPKVKRLLPNYQQVEAEYNRRTGIIPIMHTIVIRSSICNRHSWVARSLYEAFCSAKQECWRQLEETGTPKSSLIWLRAHLDAEHAVFGPDIWPYGVNANRKCVETLASYLYEQGLSERLVPVEDVFAKETLSLG